MKIPQWVLETIAKYGNVSLPPKLIKKYGITAVENELHYLTGDYSIRVREVREQVMAEIYNESHKRHEVFWIAETEERRRINGII